MSRPYYCGGMKCAGLIWPASPAVPHPCSCLANQFRWPGAAALDMQHIAPADRSPALVESDDPRARLAAASSDLDRAVPPWSTTGLYAAGVFAALRALARLSPELAELAATEAQQWADMFKDGPA